MSNGNTPRDEAEFEAFLGGQSPVSEAYDALERVQPPEVLDGKILSMAVAMAKGVGSPAPATSPPAAKPAVNPAPPKAEAKPATGGTAKPAAPEPPATPGPRPTATAPAARPPASRPDDDDDGNDVPVSRRPRWLVPAALAASVLVAVGVGVSLLGGGSSEPDASRTNPLGALFAKRARERSDAEKAAAEAAAAQEAEVVEIVPLPPPPVFEPEGPQIEDLDTALALIRRELVMANQMAATAEEARAGEADLRLNALQSSATAKAAGSVADEVPPTAPATAAAEAPTAPGVIQPRDRRLAKILELYDGGNLDLAADSLEIFLRDFEDDPISQRILDAQPKVTDVAVE